jgi:hypothetical protein
MALQPVHGSIQRNALNIVLLNYRYSQCEQSSDIGANVHYSAVFAAIINGRPMHGLTITQFKAEQIVHVRRPNLFRQLSCVLLVTRESSHTTRSSKCRLGSRQALYVARCRFGT